MPAGLEPGYALPFAARKTRLAFSGLIVAPRHKAGAPFHTGVKSVPRPIWFTTHIADLRQRHFDDDIVPGVDAVKNGRFYILPKALYHYKPNAKWGEAYENLAEILYGE